MRISRLALGLFLLTVMAVPAAAQVTPQALAKLEARRQSKPGDAGALRDLGIALFKLRRYADATAALGEASRINPRDGVTALYLGMSAEEQGDFAAATRAYTAYLATGKTKAAKDAVTQRLAAVAQRELKQQATAAIAQEQRLASQPGRATDIAVLPLSVTGPAAATYESLGRGLADLMISDFAKVPELRILERERVQAIVDEIALGRTTQVDRATAARSGRLLQAGRVVTGSMTAASAQNIQLNTQVVTVATPAATPVAGGSATGALNNLFDYEKTVVIATLRSMNVTVTPAVSAAIMGNRPTQNLQAFLVYSRGLVASDAGRLDEAANFFDNARALDPNFTAAVQHAAAARAAQAGQGMTTARIEGTLRGTSEGQIASAAEAGGSAAPGAGDALGGTLMSVLADVNPSAADAIGRPVTTASSRDAQSSSTSTDGSAPGRTATITVIIKRP
jgi:tetratricopeptide (TPR) repeat protein